MSITIEGLDEVEKSFNALANDQELTKTLAAGIDKALNVMRSEMRQAIKGSGHLHAKEIAKNVIKKKYQTSADFIGQIVGVAGATYRDDPTSPFIVKFAKDLEFGRGPQQQSRRGNTLRKHTGYSRRGILILKALAGGKWENRTIHKSISRGIGMKNRNKVKAAVVKGINQSIERISRRA